jgi:hypothetical protein
MRKLGQMTLVAVLAMFLAASAAHAAKAGGKKGGSSNDKQKTYDGTVVSVSSTSIVLSVGTDKPKNVSLVVNKDTTVTGTIKQGSKVTVTYTGNVAVSITAADASTNSGTTNSDPKKDDSNK